MALTALRCFNICCLPPAHPVGWFSGAFGPGTGAFAAFESVGDIMNLDVTMWGNAQGTLPGLADLKCQHGPVECLAMKYENCAKGQMASDDYVRFLECFDSTLIKTFPAGLPPNTVNASYATKVVTDCSGSGFATLDKCVKGDDWIKFMADAKAKTPPHNAIPIAVVNGNSSCPPPKNLIAAVCAAYKGSHPNCTKENSPDANADEQDEQEDGALQAPYVWNKWW